MLHGCEFCPAPALGPGASERRCINWCKHPVIARHSCDDCCCAGCRSYKGSHLALLIELLAGPLVGGAIADKVPACSATALCCDLII